MYIVLEGVDYTGKSTLIKNLKKEHKNYSFTKEPYNKKLVNKLLKQANNKSTTLAYLYDRANHYEDIIKHHKLNTIISDRSLISGIAYAKNLPLEIATSLNLIAVDNILPTHTIMLELNKNELIKRLGSKENDNIESRGIKYLLDIQDRLKKAINLLKLNHTIVDASLPINEISSQIKHFLEK